MKAKLIILLFTFFILNLFAVDYTINNTSSRNEQISGDLETNYIDHQRDETDLFFSEYIEGSSNNKALEIYNASGIEVNLDDFRINQAVNGGGWEYQHYFPAGATLADDDVWVIITDAVNTGLFDPAGADEVLSYPSVVHYNGNDARALEYSPDGGASWIIVDIFGNPDEDPGTGWDVAGVPEATLNHTLIRKPSVNSGNLDWTNSAGTNESNSEWIVHDQDFFNDLGTHNGSGGGDETPPTINSAVATSLTAVNITFSEVISNSTADNVSNYAIPGLTVNSAELQMSGSVVTLSTSEQTGGESYIIEINNIEDLAGNQIENDSEIGFTGFQSGELVLFISEYIEGSSNNKALEIYNASGIEVNLDDFRINQAVNGGGWEYQHYFPVGATLAADDVWVIITDEVGSALFDPANADEILSYPSVVHYNGNDARALEYSSDGGATWMIVDIFGDPDEDPGNGWDVAGVSEATFNHTLIRKSSVNSGNLSWTSSAGTNESNSEWIVHDQDYFDNLGTHQGSGADETPPVVNTAEATSEFAVEVSFNEPLDETSAENTANYQIYPALTISNAVLSGNKVTLTTSPQTEYEAYTITINNVEDLAGNVIETDSEVQFTGYGGFEYDSIADIQNNTSSYEGQTVTMRAIVTIGVNTIQTDRTNVYVQDGSGRGINVYDPQPILTLVRGSEVEITGTVTQYFDTTEITDPQVTVLSVNNPEPDPYELDLADIGNINLEGTLIVVQGVIYEQYYAGGGYNLNIRDENNNEITVRVWDTTGINTDDFMEGFNLQAIGIGSVYNSELQIVPGYQDQLSEAQNVEEGVVIEPANPTSADDVAILFTDETYYESVELYWKRTTDEEYTIVDMVSLSSMEHTWGAEIPAQKEGTTVIFYMAALLEGETTYIPEGAPDEIMSYQIDITSLKAILNVPPVPFNPYAGETINIEFGSRGGVKAILRIYNSEGKLVFTPQNLLINSSDVLTYEWNGRDKNHKLLPIGLYILHLEIIDVSSGNKRTKKAPVVIGAPLE